VGLPEFWLVAGPNGAGKTTCVQRERIAKLIPSATFLNPDDLTLAKLRDRGVSTFADAPVDLLTTFFIESANEVESRVRHAMERGDSFGVETVLSSAK